VARELLRSSSETFDRRRRDEMSSRGTGLLGLTVTTLAVGLLLAGVGGASASMNTSKKAKDAGFPVTNCTYCHVDKLPKKGASALNDRGTWLAGEKGKRKAKEVDAEWLKEYTGK
jgi:hypothetical protein